MTSKCEVSALRGDVKRWYEATVGEVKHENGQRLLFIEVQIGWSLLFFKQLFCSEYELFLVRRYFALFSPCPPFECCSSVNDGFWGMTVLTLKSAKPERTPNYVDSHQSTTV